MSKHGEEFNDVDLDAEMERMDKLSTPKVVNNPVANDWRAKLAAAKAKIVVTKEDLERAEIKTENNGNKTLPQIVPGDLGTPQNELEQNIEADRVLARKVQEEGVEKHTDKALNSEALLSESLMEHSMDRERFKKVFINTVQLKCAGKTIDEIEEILIRDHEMLFDLRTGIQAELAYRAELMKDMDAQERAERMKMDFLFKPAKEAKAAREKAERSSKPKTQMSMVDRMRAAMKAKGLDEAVINERLKMFEGK